MADVRSLLRNELATRKSTSSPNTAGNRVTKKRKVDNSEGVMRKKLRSASLESVPAGSDAPAERSPSAEGTVASEALEPVDENELAGPAVGVVAEPTDVLQSSEAAPAAPAATQHSQNVDEDEWAAFEREVAAPSRLPAAAATASSATISAAPISAEEIAAQQERDIATTSRAREAELEGEREDAARLMEEEFDEMDQLEERVRRLKHMREELRQKQARDEMQDRPMVSEAQQEAESDSEDDEEDEEWDDWRFK